MQDYCIIYFEHRNDVTGMVKLHREYSHSARILHIQLDHACDVIYMFKINDTVAFHGISANYDCNLNYLLLICVFTKKNTRPFVLS